MHSRRIESKKIKDIKKQIKARILNLWKILPFQRSKGIQQKKKRASQLIAIFPLGLQMPKQKIEQHKFMHLRTEEKTGFFSFLEFKKDQTGEIATHRN